jgi:hypothetical protein
MKKWIIGLIAFFCLVLIYTRMDYLINHDLYSYGLTFSDNWFLTNQVTYILLYQSAILILYMYHRSVRLTILFEAFVVTSTQDLVYFGLWNNGVFPTNEWTWTIYYFLIGVWNTTTQFLTSSVVILSTITITLIGKLRINKK